MSAASIEKLCLRARQAIGQREWDKAKLAYLQALGLKSDLPDVHYGLATVYFQLKELTSAAHHFREVTRLDPLRSGAFINLGAVLNLLQEYDEAVAALRRGIQIDASRVEGYYNLGLVHRRKGQPDLAIQAYREAIRLNPRMVDAHLNIANLYFDKGQFRQAVTHYEECLKLRPGWEKAIEGLETAQQAMAGGRPAQVVGAPTPRTPAPVGRTLDRNLDPAVHGAFLNDLHQATINTEEIGREAYKILEAEVEPAIKDLSSCLLYPDGPRSELDECVKKYEAAVERLRAAQKALHSRIDQLRQFSEKMPQLV
jgi:tetratricopeptide (TPR) repeat protein